MYREAEVEVSIAKANKNVGLLQVGVLIKKSTEYAIR